MAEVRTANADDASAIRNVHLAAFPTPIEADLVEALDRDGDSAISLVATENGAVVGHILFSRMQANAPSTGRADYAPAFAVLE